MNANLGEIFLINDFFVKNLKKLEDRDFESKYMSNCVIVNYKRLRNVHGSNGKKD